MSNPLLRFTFPVGRIFLIDPVKLGKTGLPMNPVGRGKTTHFSSDFCVAAETTPVCSDLGTYRSIDQNISI
jgi:hypothetical protein